MTHYDLIIRNGTLVDGSGGPSSQQDIAVKDGKIACIAPNLDAGADKIVDASNMLVTPGFVDVHTHYDGQATWDEHLNPSSSLGTTTVVMGNCGVGFAPCKPADRNVLIQLMEGVEEIPETALNEGLPWEWESFADYLDFVDSKARDIDVAALVPHGPLRVYVMGERGVNRETATDDDIKQMRELLADSVAAGAVGFSTSRTLVHRSSTGDFGPTFQAVSTELKQLGEELSGDQGHVFQLIADWNDADDEFSILRDTAAKTGAKGTFTLLDIDATPDLWRQHLDRIEAAQADGLDIRGQVIARPVGIMMGHCASMSPFYDRPSFKALENLAWDEKIERLKDPALRTQILSEKNDDPHIFVQIIGERFNKMYAMEEPINYLPNETDSIGYMAQQAGTDAEAWLYDYFLTNNGNSLVYIPVANFSDNISELIQHPNTVVALGDGGAHVGSICDTSANIYLLINWVRKQQAFGIEQGIHILTRQPAELYSLNDRGLLAVGMKADINIIDFENLNLMTPHIVHDLPAGGKRFLQNAAGILATFVAGEMIYENGEATGALPGKLVRGQQQAI
ncbi:MAG: amidohydrolase family protein [Pseudomonadales bacterium]|nr:amidohydrolase family protein [Pseudomonadales bacterium]